MLSMCCLACVLDVWLMCFACFSCVLVCVVQLQTTTGVSSSVYSLNCTAGIPCSCAPCAGVGTCNGGYLEVWTTDTSCASGVSTFEVYTQYEQCTCMPNGNGDSDLGAACSVYFKVTRSGNSYTSVVYTDSGCSSVYTSAASTGSSCFSVGTLGLKVCAYVHVCAFKGMSDRMWCFVLCCPCAAWDVC